MANQLDSIVQQIVARTAAEIASAVRTSIMEEISRIVSPQGPQGAPAKAAPVAVAGAAPRKKPGRPAKAAAAPAAKPAAAKPAAAKPAAKAPAGKKRRGVTADELALVLDFISKNPGKRSEEIRKVLGVDQDQNSKILAKLRELKKVKTKGEKRATTYFA